MEFQYWARTDVGRKRADNEDNFLIDKTLNLFVVADGMGGHASGEVASAIAVYTIRDLLWKNRDLLERYHPEDILTQMEVCTLFEHAVHEACATVHRKAQREPEKKGMGTTVVALLLAGDRGFIAYVGDSRIYLLRDNTVYPLTEDHSLMNELIRSGQVRAEDFSSSPFARYKHAMTRAVGVHAQVDVDILDFDLVPGDAFLLCSDGLYEYLDDSDIASTLALPDIEEIPSRFIELANNRGGKDNITSLVVKVLGDSPAREAGTELSIEMLGRLPLMRQLSYQQLARMLHSVRLRAFEHGEMIATEGEEGGELAIVLEGLVDLSVDGTLVRTVEEGDFFGEMDLTETRSRTATATAASDGKLVLVPREKFHEMLQSDARLAAKLLWNLSYTLSERVQMMTSELASARASLGTDQEVTEVVELVPEADIAEVLDEDDEDDDVEVLEVDEDDAEVLEVDDLGDEVVEVGEADLVLDGEDTAVKRTPKS